MLQMFGKWFRHKKKNSKSLRDFKNNIRTWGPSEYDSKFCKDFVPSLKHVNFF